MNWIFYSFFLLLVFINQVDSREQLFFKNEFKLDHKPTAKEYKLLSKLGPEAVYSTDVYGYLQNRQDRSLSADCWRDMQRVINDTDDLYVAMIFDSWGKPGAGIMDGNLRWYGSYEQCKAVRANETRYPEDAFNGKYCTISHSTLFQGICVPDTCDEDEVKTIFKNIYQNQTGDRIRFARVYCADPMPWTTGDTIMLVVIALFAILVISSTGYELCMKSKKKKEKDFGHTNGYTNGGIVYDEKDATTLKETNDIQLTSVNSMNNGHLGDDVSPSNGNLGTETTPGNGYLGNQTTYGNGNVQPVNDSIHPAVEQKNPKKEQIGMKQQILQSFSFLTNGRKMINMNGTPKGMESLNGMRVLSMAWVLLGHTYIFMPEFASNQYRFQEEVFQEFSFQFLAEAELAVDTFFFLSGFLVAFGTLKVLIKSKGKLNWALFYIHRYLRLTPSYMFVLFLMITLVVHMVSGPYQSYDFVGYVSLDACYEYWWTNLLYINTLYPESIGQSCLGWAWYLSHDMIYFIVSPLFIYALYRKKIVGYVLLALGVLGHFLTVGITFSTYNLSNPDEFKLRDLGIQQGVYFKPMYRFAPYLVGIAFADIYMSTKDKARNNKETWFKVLMAAMWVVALAVNFTLMYGMYPYNLDGTGLIDTPWVNDLYSATFRTVWAMTCGWIIYACLIGWGGFINSILSLKIWEPMCRLCYLAYLLHPIVMYTFMMNMQQTIIANHWIMAFFFSAYMGIVFGLSVVVYLLVEQPLGTLQRIVMKK